MRLPTQFIRTPTLTDTRGHSLSVNLSVPHAGTFVRLRYSTSNETNIKGRGVTTLNFNMDASTAFLSEPALLEFYEAIDRWAKLSLHVCVPFCHYAR